MARLALTTRGPEADAFATPAQTVCVAFRRGFTLLEMLTAVAALVIVLGLMVSLARHVRNRSREQLTSAVLTRLEQLLAQYQPLESQLRQVPPLVRDGNGDEANVRSAAMSNSAAVVRVLRSQLGQQLFADLPLALYDELVLRDAWGSPIVYMPPRAENIGIQPQERHFFVSAGPDRRFGTLLDNLYSYDRAWPSLAGQGE